MIVDIGASGHLIDEELIPRLRKNIRDYKQPKDPKTIMTNGKKVFATATGTIWGYIIDQAGKRVPVRISVMFVPGLGRNVFSSIKAMQSGVSIILETGNPHLQFDSSISLMLTQQPKNNGICSYEVFLRTLGDTTDTSSTPAVVPAAQASNYANRGVCTLKEIQEFCTNSSIAMEHTTTVTPQRKRASTRYGQNHATHKECTPPGGNNTPEEATVAETERQHAQMPNITPEKDIVTERERYCTLDQVKLHYYDNNLLKEETLSTTAEASSSPEIEESSSSAGALPQEVGVSLTGITPAITPGDAHSTTTAAAPDVPHHETASTRPNPRVEDTFDNTHTTGASGTTAPTTSINFTCTGRDSFRISEEENRVIKIPNDILRCHLLHGSASPGITGTGITGAGISKASSHGIFGAKSSGSPSHIGVITASGITGSTSSWITGASAGPTASHGTIGIAGSSPSGTTGESAEPRVDGSTMSAGSTDHTSFF